MCYPISSSKVEGFHADKSVVPQALGNASKPGHCCLHSGELRDIWMHECIHGECTEASLLRPPVQNREGDKSPQLRPNQPYSIMSLVDDQAQALAVAAKTRIYHTSCKRQVCQRRGRTTGLLVAAAPIRNLPVDSRRTGGAH